MKNNRVRVTTSVTHRSKVNIARFTATGIIGKAPKKRVVVITTLIFAKLYTK